MEMKGLPIALDWKTEQLIFSSKKLPEAVTHKEILLVKARVHLELRKHVQGWMPGCPSIDFYALVIDELIDVTWNGKHTD